LRSVPSFRSTFGEVQLRVEEDMDGDTLVIRAELPGIDPDKDVEITIGDGLLHIHAKRRQKQKVEEKACTGPSCATAPSRAPCRYRPGRARRTSTPPTRRAS
jgi:hypothetical protein